VVNQSLRAVVDAPTLKKTKQDPLPHSHWPPGVSSGSVLDGDCSVVDPLFWLLERWNQLEVCQFTHMCTSEQEHAGYYW